MKARETRTVLIVDSSPTMLYYHGILLMRLEYSVLTAATPEEALAILERTIPSLILTATSFPSMTGADFIKKIKLADKTRHIPVIILTAAKDEKLRLACMEMGCFAYLIKPVNPRALFRTMQSATEAVPRQNIRLSRELKVLVGGNGKSESQDGPAYTKTISEGGLYIRACKPQPKNAAIPLSLFINGREIQAEGVVLYSTDQNNGSIREPGVALKFTKLQAEDRDFLRGFIHNQLTYDIVVSAD